MPAHSRPASGESETAIEPIVKSENAASNNKTRRNKTANEPVNQASNQIAKHALLMEAGAGPCAANASAHGSGPCGTWSYVSFDMLRTDLVTIQGDPGSSG